MIKRHQLSRAFSEADVEIMNAAVAEAIFYFDVDAAALSERERAEILDTLEANVIAHFFRGRVLWETQDLLPESYRRFLTSRTQR